MSLNSEAEYVAIEQFLTTQNENELASSTPVLDDCDINESHDEAFTYFTKSCGKESYATNYKSVGENIPLAFIGRFWKKNMFLFQKYKHQIFLW